MLNWILEVLVAVAVMLAVAGPVQVAPPAVAETPAGVAGAPDVDAYIASIQGGLTQLWEGAQTMVEVMGAPAVASEEWRARAAAAFADVAAGHAALVAVEPLAGFADAHAALTAATQKCADGAGAAQAAIDDGNALGLYAAAQLVQACGEGITQFAATLDGMR